MDAERPATQPIEDWASIPWRKLEMHVYRLQKRIYRAARRGNVRAVHSLQRLLMKSEAARCLAVRRVTQDNRGKNTAGVDGIKSVSPARRPALVTALRHPAAIKPHPTRRVWIPKPGKRDQRPLGIPTMLDRAHQALVTVALEPEWEARFEPNSYGFRPGRGCHDAIEAIFNSVSRAEKFVLDADIQGCFDNIAHAPLLDKLGTYPALRRTLKGWLKAGVRVGFVEEPTVKGTPQGGVVSPLLANIALHGLETAVLDACGTDRGRPTAKVVRYADDFVVLHPTREGIETARRVVEHWLRPLGLDLKASKTRIAHTRQGLDGHVAGFDFLGFTVRQYAVGQTHRGRPRRGAPRGFRTYITPSKDAVTRHRGELSRVVREHRTVSQENLIRMLNPVIRGWSTYYRTVVAKVTFQDCDNGLFPVLKRWAARRHPNKGAKWVRRRYWRTNGGDRWAFMTPAGLAVAEHAKTPIRRHIKVRADASPYDGNLVYWARRLRDHPLVTTRVAQLLKKQGGRCARCGLFFRETDAIEADHITPAARGGRWDVTNRQALHRHCHDAKTRDDGSVTPQPS